MNPEREKLLAPKWMRLGAVDRVRYRQLIEMAPDFAIELALIMQKSVLPHLDFIAPLYLFQAEKFTTSYELRQELMKTLTKIQEL